MGRDPLAIAGPVCLSRRVEAGTLKVPIGYRRTDLRQAPSSQLKGTFHVNYPVSALSRRKAEVKALGAAADAERATEASQAAYDSWRASSAGATFRTTGAGAGLNPAAGNMLRTSWTALDTAQAARQAAQLNADVTVPAAAVWLGSYLELIESGNG